MWQIGLQSALGITKCGRADYKVRQGLQSVVGLQSELVQQFVPMTYTLMRLFLINLKFPRRYKRKFKVYTFNLYFSRISEP